MSLRHRVMLYGSMVFLILTLLLLDFTARDPPAFLIAELLLLVLGFFGYRLINAVFSPLALLADTTRLLGEQELTTRLRPVGHPEMDHLIAIYNQMSERLRNERVANQEQESFFRKVLATTPSAILVFDFDDRIEQVNPAAAAFLEIGAHDLIGRGLAELDHPLARALTAMPREATEVVPYRGRRKLRCHSGRFLDRGFFKRYLIIDELTSELRRSEKEAFEKVIRVMSHEINNSLGAAGSLLHSCLDYVPQVEKGDRDDFQTALEVVISRTDHLKRFVRDYVAMVELPRPELVPRDPGELLAHVYALMSVELRRRRITWVWDRQTVAPVALDATQMEQVLLNIVKNAAEAIEADGTIIVSLTPGKNGGAVIGIANSGPPIPETIANQLFTPFYTTKPGGQGIGLTLVADILEAHGFDFALVSPTGEPTRFTIWMP